MASFGFTLRRIVQRDSLWGTAQALLFSALLVTGPWIATMAALHAILLFGSGTMTSEEIALFRGVARVNFQFAPLIVAPVGIIAVRYFADSLHSWRVQNLPGLVVGGAILTILASALAAAVLFGYVLEISGDIFLISCVSFVAVAVVWYFGLFCSAIRRYGFLAAVFALGMFFSIVLIRIFEVTSVPMLLLCLTLGMVTIAGALAGRVLSVVGGNVEEPAGFVSAFSKYPELAIGAVALNAGIWADKWLMWFGSDAQPLSGNLMINPPYETAMMLAGLVCIPVLGLFVVNIETAFYEICRAYNLAVVARADISVLKGHQAKLIRQAVASLRLFTILQAVVIGLAIFLAPTIYHVLGLPYGDASTFRISCVASFFFMVVLFTVVFLSYFDARRYACVIQVCFLLTNVVATSTAMYLGDRYEGFGYLVACALSASLALLFFSKILEDLPFFTFVANTGTHSPRSEVTA